MKNKLLKIVFSKCGIVAGVLLFELFALPANSPLGIPSDFKVFVAMPFIFVLMWAFTENGGKGKDTESPGGKG